MWRGGQVRGEFPIRPFCVEEQAVEERPTDLLCFTRVALWGQTQREAGLGVGVGVGVMEKQPSLASVRSLWKLSPARILQEKKKRKKTPSSWQLYWGSIDKNSRCARDYKAIPRSIWHLPTRFHECQCAPCTSEAADRAVDTGWQSKL